MASFGGARAPRRDPGEPSEELRGFLDGEQPPVAEGGEDGDTEGEVLGPIVGVVVGATDLD